MEFGRLVGQKIGMRNKEKVAGAANGPLRLVVSKVLSVYCAGM